MSAARPAARQDVNGAAARGKQRAPSSCVRVCEMSSKGRRRASLDMTDAPADAVNFVEASIDTRQETFDREDSISSGEPDANPTIDTLKNTFDMDSIDVQNDGTPQRARGSSPRSALFVLLDEPDSSALARVISMVLMLMIFASSVSFVMETTEPVQSDEGLKNKLHVRSCSPPRAISSVLILCPPFLRSDWTPRLNILSCILGVGGCVHHRVYSRILVALALLHRAAR